MRKLIVLLVVLAGTAKGQNPFNITTVNAFFSSTDPQKRYVSLYFDAHVPDALISSGRGGNCDTSDSLSGGTVNARSVAVAYVSDGGIERRLSGGYSIQLTDCYSGTIPLREGDSPSSDEHKASVTIEVTFSGSTYQIKGTGQAITRDTAKKAAEQAIADFNSKAPDAKTTDQKDIFTGLSVTVPQGGGTTQGTADLNFHKEFGQFDLMSGKLVDQLVFGLTLRKGGELQTDPRHFSTGLTLRKDLLLVGRSEIQQIRDGIASGNAAGIKDLVDALPKRPFSALLIDSGIQFEGDVRGTSIGNISNLLYTLDLRLASPNYALVGNNSRVKFSIIPAALEVGGNLQNQDDPALDGKGVGRYKGGGFLNLYFDSGNPNSAVSRLQIDLSVVDRYLWKTEAALDTTTNTVTGTVYGNTYYAQANVKIFVGSSSYGRPGFQVSFTRGSLPPTYNFTKVFNFGFIFETNDDQRKVATSK